MRKLIALFGRVCKPYESKTTTQLAFCFSLIFLVLITTSKLKSQNIFEEIDSPKSNEYLKPALEALHKKEHYLSNMPKGLYYQILATNFSYIGAYQKALEFYDSSKTIKDMDESYLDVDGFESQDAKEFILNNCSESRVIMINEAHHVPMHRAFTSGLLKDLKKRGFNYFAAETLSKHDIERINNERFINLESGVYSDEPVFAELLNYALELGFTLVAYEQTESCTPPKGAGNLYCRQQREIAQANNLASVLNQDPNAKIIVHAGYDHILESSDPLRMMAQKLTEISGINPITIDQVEYSPRHDPRFNALYYDCFIESFSDNKPFVLNQDSGLYLSKRMQNRVDIQIIHPRYTVEDYRPSWLKWGRKKRVFKIDLNQLNIPNGAFLIRARKLAISLTENIPPQDQIYIDDNTRKTSLILPSGKYLIEIENEEYKVIKSWEIDI